MILDVPRCSQMFLGVPRCSLWSSAISISDGFFLKCPFESEGGGQIAIWAMSLWIQFFFKYRRSAMTISAYLKLQPTAGIKLIGLHSATLFDIDLIIIAFFLADPRLWPSLAIQRRKSWFVLRVLQFCLQAFNFYFLFKIRIQKYNKLIFVFLRPWPLRIWNHNIWNPRVKIRTMAMLMEIHVLKWLGSYLWCWLQTFPVVS